MCLTWTKSASVRRRTTVFVVVILLLTVLLQGAAVPAARRPQTSSDTEELLALDELTRVFDVQRVSDYYGQRRRDSGETRRHHVHHRSPPEYMVQLYSTIAYTDGISKTAAPYEADIVHGIPDKAGTQQVFYFFNVSHIEASDVILEAELRLFKMRPTPQVRRQLRRRQGSRHIADVRLYEVLRDNVDPPSAAESSSLSPAGVSDEHVDGLRLVQRRRVSTRRPGWEVFQLRNVIRRWVKDPSTNRGLLMTATSLDGVAVNGSLVRFAQRREHHDSKQPVLVVFSEQNPQRQQQQQQEDEDSDDTDIEDDVDFRPPTVSSSSLQAMRRKYIRFLNEAPRAEHDARSATSVGRRRPNTHYMSPTAHQRLVNVTMSASGRLRRSPTRRRRRTCQRHEMYVDFERIGWSGWIISPKGYNAYQCRGACPFPLGQNQHPSNHATVQSIVHALRIGGGGSGNGLGDRGTSIPVDTPCCVPNKLYSISLLYFDDEENVILKQYDEMVALNCGCH